MKAPLIVDVQNDFLPGGALPVPDGDRVIPEINRLMDQFDLVLASKDWHPEKSVHFKNWPRHCIRDTEGAEFPEELHRDKIKKTFLKGTRNKDDGYSAFEATSANLDKYLQKKKVSHLYIAGLATEFCVRETAEEANKKGYDTVVIASATAGINKNPDDEATALRDMFRSGIRIIDIKT
jgi:nicotinamidase/pyrazinamidase